MPVPDVDTIQALISARPPKSLKNYIPIRIAWFHLHVKPHVLEKGAVGSTLIRK